MWPFDLIELGGDGSAARSARAVRKVGSDFSLTRVIAVFNVAGEIANELYLLGGVCRFARRSLISFKNIDEVESKMLSEVHIATDSIGIRPEARILQLEEEALIEQALAAGVDCHRRPSPWPRLGIEPDTAAG